MIIGIQLTIKTYRLEASFSYGVVIYIVVTHWGRGGGESGFYSAFNHSW